MRVLALLAASALAGCESLAYYAQAVGGHFALLGRARPVAEILAEGAAAPELRERLMLAQEIREFASRELKLPRNESYRRYADLGRPYAVWNVVATPEFSLAPVQSCFPVAGCVAYRGFFSREGAERHAARLRESGHDVFVYGVPAYSTLGFFADPLLSTFIGWPEVDLARLVFHELAHQLVYSRSDSTFNESFAVVVEEEGVRRWLAATGTEAQMENFRQARRRAAEFSALLDDARTRLGAIYRSGAAPEIVREKKRAELQRLGSDPVFLRHAKRFETPPNNALLAAFGTYSELVPAFERLLAAEGGDLERFYARVRELAQAGRRPN